MGMVVGVIAMLASAAGAQTTYLYQGSGTQTPQSQGWLSEFAPGVTPVSSGGTTTFDSTSSASLEGGYSNDTVLGSPVNAAFPSLNPNKGFSVSLDVEINSESHGNNDNRAGFDWIVLGSDNKGVELDFWDTNIWAQQYNTSNSTFTKSATEDVDAQNTLNFDSTFSTQSAINDYVLSVQGTNYYLTDNGSLILDGQTHDYTASGMEPYTLANYIFIGDDTSEAAASETFSTLSVTVPEPASAGVLLMIGSAALARRRRA
jgi:MprA protease rhombosortase-interaction domain-containing protein